MLYFFRDSKGNEVDLVIDNGNYYTTVEIKSAMTFTTDFLKGLQYYSNLNPDVNNRYIAYSGTQRHSIKEVDLIPYEYINEID